MTAKPVLIDRLSFIREAFPGLIFCKIIDKSHKKEKAHFISKFEADLDLLNMFQWIFEGKYQMDFIRTKLKSGLDFIAISIQKDTYIFIVNQTENIALLLRFIRNSEVMGELLKPETEEYQTKSIPEPSTQPLSGNQDQDDLLNALRIQNMIFPKLDNIRSDFKDVFVVHKQLDIVGGDFYWYKVIGDYHYIALIDCTGHGVEGAMTSMVCNSLLNQVILDFDHNDVSSLVKIFLKAIHDYNDNSGENIGYGLGAEIGICCVNKLDSILTFSSSGIGFVVKRNDKIESVKVRKLMQIDQYEDIAKPFELKIESDTVIYLYSDGLTDLFDKNDSKKLGKRGVIKMVENEEAFDSDFYASEIMKWSGTNKPYDDITLVGIKI